MKTLSRVTKGILIFSLIGFIISTGIATAQEKAKKEIPNEWAPWKDPNNLNIRIQMIEPYADKPDSTGLVSFTPEVQKAATLKAAKLGFDIHTHSIGDLTVRQSLDAFEAARKAGYEKDLFSIGHTMLVHPDDISRFKELNVFANTFATKNAIPDETILARLGPERYKRVMPMGTLLDVGARLTMSADYQTAPVNPWLQISICMTRHDPGNGSNFLGMEEDKLTLEQSIMAYTIESAHAMRWGDIILRYQLETWIKKYLSIRSPLVILYKFLPRKN